MKKPTPIVTGPKHTAPSPGAVALAAGRLRVTRAFPYLTRVALSLRPVPRPGLGTTAVDSGLRLYYDPDIVATWGAHGCAFAVAHEIGHVMQRHSDRLAGRDPKRWNVAGDLSINPALIAAGLVPPSGMTPCLPNQHGWPNGLTADQYYDLLTQEAQQQQQGQQQQGQQQQGQQQPAAGQTEPGAEDQTQTPDQTAGGSTPPAPGTPPPPPPGDPAGTAAGTPAPGDGPGPAAPGTPPAAPSCPGTGDSPCCGSIAGHKHEGETPDAQTPDAASDTDREIVCRATAAAIQEHVRQRGTVPGEWKTWADATLAPPTVPWQSKLRARTRGIMAAARQGNDDTTYSRPCRRTAGLRSAWRGLPPILPGSEAHTPRIAVILDTSGSMAGLGGTVLTEALAIVRASGSPVDVIGCDAQAAKPIRARNLDDIRRACQGGGGTDMTVGIDAALELRHRPSLIIVLTDGYTPWPEPRDIPRGVKVLAAIIDGERPPKHIDCVTIPRPRKED